MSMAESNMAEPNKYGKIRHRTVTLEGRHNRNKVLMKFGATAAEIQRDKALKRLGGTEESYQQTMRYMRHNQHHHASSVSMSVANVMRQQHQTHPADALEVEYTQNSQTQETITQSVLNSRRSSQSESVTYSPYPAQPSQKTHSSHSAEHSKSKSKKTVPSASVDSIVEEEDEEEETVFADQTPSCEDMFASESQGHGGHVRRKPSYAQDDVNNGSDPPHSAKLFKKRKSDSFFLHNSGVLLSRKYVSKKDRSSQVTQQQPQPQINGSSGTNPTLVIATHNCRNSALENDEKETAENNELPWVSFDDDNDNRQEQKQQQQQQQQPPPPDRAPGYQSKRHKTLHQPHHHQHVSKPKSVDISEYPSYALTHPPVLAPSRQKSVDHERDRDRESSKQQERERWKRSRRQEQQRYALPQKSELINTGPKIRRIFGDDPVVQNKIAKKVGVGIDEMMNIRSIQIAEITKRDDEIRKKDKRLFTNKTRIFDKLTQLKLHWRSKSSSSSAAHKNFGGGGGDDSRNFLRMQNRSSGSLEEDMEHKECGANGNGNGNESAASTQSTDTENDAAAAAAAVAASSAMTGITALPTMIIHAYNRGLSAGTSVSYQHGRNASEPSQQMETIMQASPPKRAKIGKKKKEKERAQTPKKEKEDANLVDQSPLSLDPAAMMSSTGSAAANSTSIISSSPLNPLLVSSKKTTKRTSTKRGLHFSSLSRSPSPNDDSHKNNAKSKKTHPPRGLKPNGHVNLKEMHAQSVRLQQFLRQRKNIAEIIDTLHVEHGYCLPFIVALLANIDRSCPQYVSQLTHCVDKQIPVLRGLSLWQFILHQQTPGIDIKRFFYSYGPLIGKYKTLVSPLHLAARKLNELTVFYKETHVSEHTSSPETLYAFEIFKWLLFIGYDIDDGDIDGKITPQSTLHQSPRVLRQILSYQRSFLHKQRECMSMVDDVAYREYKLLMDDDILQVIEKFAFHKYRHNRGPAHKKFTSMH